MNDVPEFCFEHEFEMTVGDYLAFNRALDHRTRWGVWIVAFVIGVACLFWEYTFLIGALLLTLLALRPLVIKLALRNLPAIFSRSKHLHRPITYSVSNKGLAARSPHFSVRSNWENLYLWRADGPWLTLNAHGLPPFYFRIAELKTAGVWPLVDQLIRSHGLEFDSDEAKRTA